MYPDEWKDSITVVVRKPGKPDYTVPGAYRPIALLSTMGKILSSCITGDIACMAEMHNLLPHNHFGCHPGRSTSDSLHYVTRFVKDAWRKGQVVSALFLDIKSAFPSVILSQLIHNMRRMRVLEQYTSWIKMKVEDRRTTMRFNGYTSKARRLRRGIDQGCPLSGIIFQFYNADLLELGDSKRGEDAVGFVDNMLLLAHTGTLGESNGKVKAMMEKEGGARPRFSFGSLFSSICDHPICCE